MKEISILALGVLLGGSGHWYINDLKSTTRVKTVIPQLVEPIPRAKIVGDTVASNAPVKYHKKVY